MLGYRSFLTSSTPGDELLDTAVRSFREWLKGKGGRKYDGDALELGQFTRFTPDAVALLSREDQPDGSRAIRASLTETNEAGRWITRFTAGAPREGKPWLWIDIDGPAEMSDGSGRRQWVSTPKLARSLLSYVETYDGIASVADRPIRAFPEDVGRLIDIICDPDRRGLPACGPIPFPNLFDQFRWRGTPAPHIQQERLHILQAIRPTHGHQEHGNGLLRFRHMFTQSKQVTAYSVWPDER